MIRVPSGAPLRQALPMDGQCRYCVYVACVCDDYRKRVIPSAEKPGFNRVVECEGFKRIADTSSAVQGEP